MNRAAVAAFLLRHWFKVSILVILAIGIAEGLNAYRTAQQDRLIADESAVALAHQAQRRAECLDIYKEEQKNWNNTDGFEYDALTDVCRVYYRDKAIWKGQTCADWLEIEDFNGITTPYAMRQWRNCTEGRFDKEF